MTEEDLKLRGDFCSFQIEVNRRAAKNLHPLGLSKRQNPSKSLVFVWSQNAQRSLVQGSKAFTAGADRRVPMEGSFGVGWR